MKPEAGDGRSGWRWVATFDLILRLAAIVATSTAVLAAMGKTFVVVVNGVACFYLLMSLPVSIFNIMRPGACPANRAVLTALDMVTVALVTAGALVAGILYLVHKAGDTHADWFSIWSQLDSLSYLAVLALILHVLLSGSILYKQALNIMF
uniref:CASP-like protein 2 n=1 Tax=Picea sitchensis TaxID=3332 RepID=CSPL2_PICSI|nr:RecName: Full=CASP-like protein 2 [Picea sitchensis]ABK24053.1 unknown [Picea sitchensis]